LTWLGGGGLSSKSKKAGISGRLNIVSVGVVVGEGLAVAVGLGVWVGEGTKVTKASTRVGGIVGLELGSAAWLVHALNASMKRRIHAKKCFPINFLSASEYAFVIAQKINFRKQEDYHRQFLSFVIPIFLLILLYAC
jgi:hypothetical protein